MQTAGSVLVTRTGFPEDTEAPTNQTDSIPLKDRMAMYQAAVSKQGGSTHSAGVMEESEVCSLPGGLAGVRKQFEDIATTQGSATQFHFHHRSVQEVSNSSQVMVMSSSRVSHNQTVHQNVASSAENHLNETARGTEEEDLPRLSAKELAQHFEKTIEEATPSKQIKIRVPKSEMCTVCRRRVFPMESLIVDRKNFHKTCFSCEHCQSKLSLGNYVSLDGHLYCVPHYNQLLKSKGHLDEAYSQNSLKDLQRSRHQQQTIDSSKINVPSDILDWRYSISQSSISSADMYNVAERETLRSPEKSNLNANKISLAWPPEADPPRKPFAIEADIKVVKPRWPPKNDSPRSPKTNQKNVQRKR